MELDNLARIITRVGKPRNVCSSRQPPDMVDSNKVTSGVVGCAGAVREQRETIRPELNPAIMINFQGAKITSDTCLLLLREIDERFGILGPIRD